MPSNGGEGLKLLKIGHIIIFERSPILLVVVWNFVNDYIFVEKFVCLYDVKQPMIYDNNQRETTNSRLITVYRLFSLFL